MPILGSYNGQTTQTAVSLGGLSGNPANPHNDQYDAYRHALTSAWFTEKFGSDIAKILGDLNESNWDPDNPQGQTKEQHAAEKNMDLWNNNVGREEYWRWRRAVENGETNVPLEKWIYDRVKDGTTINHPIDHRPWVEPDRRDVSNSTNDNWNNAKTPPRRDPLAIDLDGDGIETVGLPTAANPFNPVLFDHNADGVRTGTGWVRPDDAWLALDRNGNGLIDSGRELFGVDTIITAPTVVTNNGLTYSTNVTRSATNGFEALRSLDSNADNVFNASDAEFANVRLWQDTNQDGISQASELKTLTQQGISSISLTPNNSNINLGNGNTVTGQAAVTRANGTTTTVAGVGIGAEASNLNLADNPFYRQFNDAIPLTAAAKALPGMGGHLRNGVNLYAANSDAYRLSLAWG
jgi:hypothetical protein